VYFYVHFIHQALHDALRQLVAFSERHFIVSVEWICYW